MDQTDPMDVVPCNGPTVITADLSNPMTGASPTVSVIIATYNRSNVLRYAIETVRRQSFTDWELLVIGDACTDDTEAVVAGFADDRVRFWNLEERCGEQSGPTNSGMAIASGRYMALLNHDDLWTPRHLAVTVEALEADASVDLVYGMNLQIHPHGELRVQGPTPSGEYEDHVGIPASAWVFRRSLPTRIGGWRAARELYNLPSQDWLQRARRGGARARLVPRLSVVSIPSGNRARSYLDRAEVEHALWFARMTRTADWESALLCEALRQADLASHHAGSAIAIGPFLIRAGKNVLRRALALAGVRPNTAALWLYHRRRGGFIDHVRRVRGLDPLPRKDEP